MNTIFDLSFRITGDHIPFDHGYVLYSGLSKLQPKLHEADWLAIHPINGLQTGRRLLRLTSKSRLRLRIPSDFLSMLLPLAGKRLILADDKATFSTHVGVPELHLLKPKHELFSRCVTIKVSEAEKSNQPPNRDMFLAAVRAQMQKLGVDGEAWVDDKRDSKGREFSRRVIHIKGQTIVGYSVYISNLSEEHSLKLQEVGIGGRRRFGAGIFNPTVSRFEAKERRS